MGTEWTDNQKKAINAPVGNLLVSAAAGSGKTAVMVERIINRIVGEDRVDVDRMLIVTYTNAAASEIKERIMSAVIKKMEETEDKNLERQLVLINSASICTIHSFCLDIIRSNFNKINLSPDFRLATGMDTDIIFDEAIDCVFEQYYSAEDEGFLNLVRSYTGKNDIPLAELVKKLYRFSRSIPDSEGWLGKWCEITDVSDSPLLVELLESARLEAAEAVALYDRAIELCRRDAGCGAKIDFLAAEKAPFEALMNCDDWDRAYKILSGVRFETFRKPSGEYDLKLWEEIVSTRQRAKSIGKDIGPDYVSSDIRGITAELEKIQPVLKCLCEITAKVASEYAERKRRKNVIEFSDFEHMCLDILSDGKGGQSGVAVELMNRFDEIYIDEYQDCNSVQEEIFKLISGANKGCPNVFTVGDMKQSIYRFRDANPKLFKDKSDTYPMYGDEPQPESKILLNTNFRSRSQVIDCVNSVFRQLMTVQTGELDYTEDEYLYCGSDSYTEICDDQLCTDIVFINNDGLPEDYSQGDDEFEYEEDEAAEYSKEAAEAAYIAKRIQKMVDDPEYRVFDKNIKGFRRVEYRDIVILMRGIPVNSGAYSDVFKAAGIPLFVDVKEYFDAPEIDFLISFMKIIDNPMDDIPLVATMHHPLFGFSDDELLTIRLCAKKAPFYKAVTKYKDNDDALGAKCRYFVGVLQELWHKSRYLSVNQLLEYAIDKTDYLVYLSSQNNGTAAKSNVRMLFHFAKEYENSNFKGLFNFINYITKIREKRDTDKITSAKMIGENDNVVRIMTIHKSKGLEFPVVFLARATTKFNKRDLTAPVLLHKEHGIGMNVTECDRRISYPSVIKKAIRHAMLRECISEEMRILYVALTRAREKLIVVGCQKDPEGYIEKLCQRIESCKDIISPAVSAKANSFMDWIVMSALRNPHFRVRGVTPPYIMEDNARFVCRIYSSDSLTIGGATDEAEDIELGKGEPDSEIVRLLDFAYPYANMTNIPGNISVTELKRMAMEEESSVYSMYGSQSLAKPDFAVQDGVVSGAHKGTLIHFVMEKIDFLRSSIDEIQHQIDSMLERGQITQKEHRAVKAEDISAFINSSLGREIVAHYDSFCREYSFKYLMNADEIYPGAEPDDIIIQGVIDAFFVNDNGKIVLIDYKTDKIVESEEKTARKYEAQLKYYAIAIEKILGKEVESKYIHLFEAGKTIKM